MATMNLEIGGMHCGSCVRRVTQLLNGLPDTHAEQVALGKARVTTSAAPETLLEALHSAGFPSQVSAQQP